MNVSLWTMITALFLLCVVLYFFRRKQKLDRMEEEEAWRESLYDHDQETDF